MERKYELTDETIIRDGRILHRIRAVRDFADVKAGELGGWIEKESNLDQDGCTAMPRCTAMPWCGAMPWWNP